MHPNCILGIWNHPPIQGFALVLIRTLTFRRDGEQLVDEETGSGLDEMRGRAISGPLAGQTLQQVPSLSSYDWAWRDFYPESAFWIPLTSAKTSGRLQSGHDGAVPRLISIT